MFNVVDTPGLLSAMATAQANGEDDTINLAAGTYTLTAVNNTDVFGNPNGLPTPTDGLRIIGAGSATTIIERDSGAPDFRFMVVPSGSAVLFQDVTLTGGQLLSGSAGAIVNTGTLTIDGCEITNNTADYTGGVQSQDGGPDPADLTIRNSLLSGNTATVSGGAVRAVGRHSTRIHDSTITGNSAGSSGAIDVSGSSLGISLLTINGTTISSNSATANGAAIGTGNVQVTIYRSQIIGNTTTGGGVVRSFGGRISIVESLVSGNTSPTTGILDMIGGAIFVGFEGGTEIVAVNSTFSGNNGLLLTTFPGGGKNSATFTNCTITSNTTTANSLGALAVDPGNTVTLRNTILAGNTNNDNVAPNCSGTVKSLGNNVIGLVSSCDFKDKPSDQTDVNANLGALAANGGPTMTHLPLAGSPAIDKGLACPGVDQRGFARAVDGDGSTTDECDVGATEVASSAFVVGPDHYLCDSTKASTGSTKFAGTSGVTLADDLATGTFDLKKGSALCNPADKLGGGVVNTDDHLRDFAIKATATTFTGVTGLRLRNQFGDQLFDLKKATNVLVPSALDLASPPLPPGAPAVDNFTCYQAKVNSGGAKFPKGISVSVEDAFEHRTFSIVKPVKVCAATSRNGGAVLAASQRLVCYSVKPIKSKAAAITEPKYTPETSIFLANGVASEKLDTVKEKELCVPSVVVP